MAKYLDVGHSWRTDIKHDIMSALLGREIGVENRLRDIKRGVWLDLTAGNAAIRDGSLRPWTQACSVGTLAHHARWEKARKTVVVGLCDHDPGTYGTLLVNLAEHLPGLGYQPVGAGWYVPGIPVPRVILGAQCRDSRTVDIEWIKPTDAVFVLNDGNSMENWAMRSTLAAELAERTRYSLCLSTMGCNPAGLKRLPASKRTVWFDHVENQEQALPLNRDLVIARIDSDPAQFAYLLSAPVVWRDDVAAELQRIFRKHERSATIAWLRQDASAFDALKNKLILTRDELAALEKGVPDDGTS